MVDLAVIGDLQGIARRLRRLLLGVEETILEVVLSTTAMMMRTTTVVMTMAIMVLNMGFISSSYQ
jgi:hypothetical protein